MHVYINKAKDRVALEGEVPVLPGQRGTPGGYEIQLTWAQALELATILERLSLQIAPVPLVFPYPLEWGVESVPSPRPTDDD